MRTEAYRNRQGAFTLIELLVVVAIIGTLTAIAIPAYNGYVTSSRQSVAKANLNTLRLAEEAYYYDYNQYYGGTYDPAGSTTAFTSALGWKPDQDGNNYVYAVVAGDCGDIKNCYTMTASYKGTVLDTQKR